MAAKYVIEQLTDGYRLRVGDEVSESVPYGQPLQVELGGELYLSLLDFPEGQDEGNEIESPLGSWLYCVTPIEESAVEFTDVDDEEDGDEDDDDDDGEEDDEEDEDDGE